AEQLVARQAGQARLAARDEPVVQAPVGQLHDDDQIVADDLDAVQGEDERVADGLDALDGMQLFEGTIGARVEGTLLAVDELDGLGQAAGGLALPDLAEAAAAERFEQAVAGNGDGDGVLFGAHGKPWGRTLTSHPKRTGGGLAGGEAVRRPNL